MILLILCGVVVLVGVIALIVSKCIDAFSSTYAPEWLENISVGCIMLGVIVGVVLLAISLGVYIDLDVDYVDMAEERQALILALELAEDGNVNLTDGGVYTAVARFNAELRTIKRWADNPWVNILYNHRIAHEIDYIELPGVVT